MKGKTEFGLIISLSMLLGVFLLAWMIAGFTIWAHYQLTVLAEFNELTVPIGLETYYGLLAIGFGALWGLMISVPASVISFPIAYIWY